MNGHTDRATINARRPMSGEMVDLLRRAASPGGVFVMPHSGDVSRIRALRDRGYVNRGSSFRDPWRATEAGIGALP